MTVTVLCHWQAMTATAKTMAPSREEQRIVTTGQVMIHGIRQVIV
jgi:hypothetical protein